MGDDKAADLGLPWYARLGLKLGRNRIVSKFTALFQAKPGVMRTVLALYVLLVVALPLAGRPEVAHVVVTVGTYLGIAAQAAGVPVDPAALGAALGNFLAATLALLALLRPVVRWVMAGFAVRAGSDAPAAASR